MGPPTSQSSPFGGAKDSGGYAGDDGRHPDAVGVKELKARLSKLESAKRNGEAGPKAAETETKKASAQDILDRKKQEAKQHGIQGDNHFKASRWKAARESYTKAISLDPTYSGSYSGRGGAVLRDPEGKPEEALKDLDKALQLDYMNMFALRDRAEAKLRTKDYQGALADYNRKLQMAPADGRALCGRAETKHKMGDTAGAQSDMKQVDSLGYRRPRWLTVPRGD